MLTDVEKHLSNLIRREVQLRGASPALDKRPGDLGLMDYVAVARAVLQDPATRELLAAEPTTEPVRETNPCADIHVLQDYRETSPLRGYRSMGGAPRDGRLIRVRLGPTLAETVAWYTGDPVYDWAFLDRDAPGRPGYYVNKITERFIAGWLPLSQDGE